MPDLSNEFYFFHLFAFLIFQMYKLLHSVIIVYLLWLIFWINFQKNRPEYKGESREMDGFRMPLALLE